MKKEYLFEAIGELDDDIVKGATVSMKIKKQTIWKSFGAMAACLALVLCGTFMFNSRPDQPNPDKVQVTNPLMEVASVEEMEQYLDFEVPVLGKEVEAYIVIVLDEVPDTARISYADGSTFSMKYGSGDISGIYGGKLEKEAAVDGISVEYYTYNDTHYALWENNGFTHSLTGGENLEEEVAELIP